MYLKINEPFNKKYNTYVIGYCIDYNEWFITNERCWFFQFDEEFDSYEEAKEWFINNGKLISNTQIEILKNCGGHKPNGTLRLIEKVDIYGA